MNQLIKAFKMRRKMRLMKRGIRMDDGEEEKKQNNNNKKGGEKESHGNTRLPYGIAKGLGLDTTGMTPKEVWAMLAGHGISAEEEYAKLAGKEVTPKVPEVPKVSTLKRGTYEYKELSTYYSRWSDMPWKIYGKSDERDSAYGTTGRDFQIMSFLTKEDMLWYLKDAGVEEFADEKGEKINPKEMELPEYSWAGGDGTHYKDLKLGYSGGKFKLKGTTFSGKSRTLAEGYTLSELKGEMNRLQVSEDKVKTSASAKKKDAEMTAWKTAKKKTYYMKGSIAVYGLKLEYGGFGGMVALTGTNEYGRTDTKRFGSMEDAQMFLKQQGVEEVAGIDGSTENPMEYDLPDDISSYTEFANDGIFYKDYIIDYRSDTDEFVLRGIGIDGKSHNIYSSYTRWEPLDKFKRIIDNALKGKTSYKVSDDAEKWQEAKQKYEEEKERRRREEEEKKRLEKEKAEREFKEKEEAALKDKNYHLYDDGHVYTGFTIDCDGEIMDGVCKLKAKDVDGREKTMSSWTSYSEIKKKLKSLGIDDFDACDYYSGEVLSVPKNGITKASIKYDRTAKKYTVYVDKDTGETEKAEFTGDREECNKWLEDNGINHSKVKAYAPVPNDDIVRTPTASLSKFDAKRRDFISKGKCDICSVSLEDQDTFTEMLTEMFTKGSYAKNGKPSGFMRALNGHFKNIFETKGKSSGCGGERGMRLRKETEERCWGMTGDEVPMEQREKYGYWSSGTDEESLGGFAGSWYGNIQYTFKKDSTKDRVTYTFGDSLDCRSEGSGYAGAQPTIEGLAPMSSSRLKSLKESYKNYKDGKISFYDFWKEVRTNCTDGYVECQLHGNLDFSDVEKITFAHMWDLTESFENASDKQKKEAYKKLTSLGIKMQYVDNDKIYDAYEFLRKQYPGIENP